MTESTNDPAVTTTTETTVASPEPATEEVAVETPAKDETSVEVPADSDLANAPAPSPDQDA